MPLPAALMIGGGLLSGIGMLGQARAGRRAQRQMNRLASGVQGQYDAALAPIGGLLTELQGQNLGQMGLEQARMAGYGFDRGTAEASAAMRGAGRNAYGRMMGAEQIRQEAALGQAALGATANLRQQNLSARMGLSEVMAQGQMRAADTANQIRLGGIQSRQQSAQQAYGQLAQVGGFAFGAGLQAKTGKYLAGLNSGGNTTQAMPPTSMRLQAPISMRGPAVLNEVGLASLPDFSDLPTTASDTISPRRNNYRHKAAGLVVNSPFACNMLGTK